MTRLWQLFLLALESLRRARLRAALTTAGIAIATGALVSMIAFASDCSAKRSGRSRSSACSTTSTSPRARVVPPTRGRPPC